MGTDVGPRVIASQLSMRFGLQSVVSGQNLLHGVWIADVDVDHVLDTFGFSNLHERFVRLGRFGVCCHGGNRSSK